MIADRPPRVSLGMPVYNGEHFIEEALDALLNQTFSDFELIISDNASTDRTPQIVSEYAARDPRVHFIRNDKNLGASPNFNKVFTLSKGEYFKWASADDVCGPNFLKRCVEVLDRYPDVALAYPKTVIIDENSREVGLYDDQLDLQAGQAWQRYSQFHRRFQTLKECNAVFGLIRSSLLRQTRLIDAFSSSDVVLLSELALLGKYYEIPDAMFYRRDHASSSIRANPSLKTRTAWFDPNKPHSYFPHWRILFEFYRSIGRFGPASRVERLRCYRELWDWQRRRQKTLRRELRVFMIDQILALPAPVVNSLRRVKRLWNGLRNLYRSHRARVS